jgi:hypothetical protein
VENMLDIKKLPLGSVTGSIRLSATASATSLFMARTGPANHTTSPFFEYEMVLTAYSLDGAPSRPISPVTVPLLSPQMPAWDLAAVADGQYELAISIFGGGWSELVVNGVNGGKLTPAYAYTVEDSTFPRFVRPTGSIVDAQYVAAILSGEELAIIAPQPPEPDGTVTVKILTLVKKAALGVVFGDLSNRLPSSFDLLYQVNRTTGPLNRDGTFAGTLWFAPFDSSGKGTLGTPVALLADMAFAGFDVAVNAGTYCVLAVTGDGAPLLAAFDSVGKPVGEPFLPVGAWNNTDHSITSPTIVAAPTQPHAFTFAFVDTVNATPDAIYWGTYTAIA